MSEHASCTHWFGISDYQRIETIGRGFTRRKLAIYTCPQCGKETKLRVNWHGPTPRGAIACAHSHTIATATA